MSRVPRLYQTSFVDRLLETIKIAVNYHDPQVVAEVYYDTTHIMASRPLAASAAAAAATPVEPAPGLTDAEVLDGLEHLHYPSQDAFKPSWLKQLETNLVESKGEAEKFRNLYSEKTQELYMKDQ